MTEHRPAGVYLRWLDLQAEAQNEPTGSPGFPVVAELEVQKVHGDQSVTTALYSEDEARTIAEFVAARSQNSGYKRLLKRL